MNDDIVGFSLEFPRFSFTRKKQKKYLENIFKGTLLIWPPVTKFEIEKSIKDKIIIFYKII